MTFCWIAWVDCEPSWTLIAYWISERITWQWLYFIDYWLMYNVNSQRNMITVGWLLRREPISHVNHEVLNNKRKEKVKDYKHCLGKISQRLRQMFHTKQFFDCSPPSLSKSVILQPNSAHHQSVVWQFCKMHTHTHTHTHARARKVELPLQFNKLKICPLCVTSTEVLLVHIKAISSNAFAAKTRYIVLFRVGLVAFLLYSPCESGTMAAA